MKEDIIIGVDAGTSVIKSVAFSALGEQLAVAAIGNSYSSAADGAVEQDMARTWSDAAATLRRLSEMVPDLHRRLVAVSVTGQGDGTWLMDDAGEPVGPAWLWLDSRAASIAEEFIAHPGYGNHYARTGTGVNACQQSTHLVWLKRHRPEAIARAAAAMHCKDWLFFRLTGARATDPSEANFTFGDFASRRYAPAILDHLGAADCIRLLPRISDGTVECIGLSRAAAALTGLPAGVPVTLGYVDVVCTGLGGGLFDPAGRAGCTILGSTGMHMKLAPSPDRVKLNAERSGYTMAFPAPGINAQMQSNMAATLNVDWLLDMAIEVMRTQGLERARRDILRGLDERVMARPAAQAIYHPYISRAGERGPFLDPAARAQFTGLDQSMGYADLMRCVFEGLCFAARDCYAAMGEMPGEVRVTGGAARSTALRTILASSLKADIRAVERDEAGAAGAAMIAAVQQKLYPDMAACAAQWVDPLLGQATAPEDGLGRLYDRVFAVYRDIRIAARPVWRELRALREESRHAA